MISCLICVQSTNEPIKHIIYSVSIVSKNILSLVLLSTFASHLCLSTISLFYLRYNVLVINALHSWPNSHIYHCYFIYSFIAYSVSSYYILFKMSYIHFVTQKWKNSIKVTTVNWAWEIWECIRKENTVCSQL